VPIPVTCRGSFALSVEDSKTFLVKMIGTVTDFNTTSLSHFFRGVITENVKNAITKISKEQSLSPLELESIVTEVGNAVRGIIDLSFRDFGIGLKLFNIEAIPVIDDDQRVKDVVAQYQKMMGEDAEERLRLKRRAENLEIYKVERSFDTTEKIAENMGGGFGDGGNIVGTMIGMGMVNPIANQMGNMMQNNLSGSSQNTSSQMTNDEIIKLLEQLGKLKADGILTEDEFNEKKKELLSQLR
jgi:membrane protease subunit (stomatin/prohibitin family)